MKLAKPNNTLIQRNTQLITAVKIILSVLGIGALLGFMVLFMAEPWGTVGEEQGIVSGLYKPSSGAGNRPARFLVTLEEGHEVQVVGTSHIPYRKGQPIIVIKKRSRILGRVQYTLGNMLPMSEPEERLNSGR